MIEITLSAPSRDVVSEVVTVLHVNGTQLEVAGDQGFARSVASSCSTWTRGDGDLRS